MGVILDKRMDMQKFLSYIVLSFLIVSPVKAEEVMSEDMLLGNNVSTTVDTDSSEETNDSTDFSLWNFIKKPLSLFSSSASDEIVSEDGKQETFLEKSERQAKDGNLEDQMNLGYMYLYGTNGVEQNFEKAFTYYTMAAEQKDAVALNNLGSLYFSGIGTNKNIRKALEFFNEAVELGNDNAAVNLAFIYLSGGKKDEERNTRAIKLFNMAAEKGNNIAKFMLGYAYYKGFMLEPDYAKAYKLISAAAGGDALFDEAQMVKAEMLIEGIGTVQNYKKGISSLRAAVSQGNLEAIVIAANIYSKGKYVKSNLLMSHALYNIAAAQSVPQAAEFRDEIAKKMPLEQLSQAQAEALKFKPTPSELTSYIRQTFGTNVRNYIDNNM